MIKIVWGAPLSGKSSYVKRYFQEGDVRYDYDELKQCIGLTGTHEEGTAELRDMLLSLRGTYLNKAREMDDITAWLICTRPSDFIREAAGPDAEYIYMDVSEDECLKRLEKDDTRPDKELMRQLIRRFFAEQEEGRSMPIRENREYRNLGSFETREEGENYIVTGYASTFDRYPLYEEDGVIYYEQIMPDAFRNTDMSDVVFLRDHEGRAYARTKNGSVKLSVDDKGLFTETNLGLTDAARDMYDEIKVQNYTQMSFSFVVDEDGYDERTHTRKIYSIRKIFDISAVIFPANPYTNIGVDARSVFNGFIEKAEADRLAAAALKLEKEKLLAYMAIVRGGKNGN